MKRLYYIMIMLILFVPEASAQVSSGIVIVRTVSSTPDSIIKTNLKDTLCPGESTGLVVSGGSLGTDAKWMWYKDTCGVGPPFDSGSSITVIPDDFVVTYYCTAEGGCNTTPCEQITLYMNLGPDCSPLPLAIKNFSAFLYEQHKGLIKWSITDEQDIAYYLLEESIDGKTFINLGKIFVADDILNNEYEFIDEQLTPGKNFYRLKIVEKDGGYLYSTIALLLYTPGRSEGILYPNPADGYIYFEYSSNINTEVSIWISNAAGQSAVPERAYKLEKGKNLIKQELEELAAGAYIFYYRVPGGDRKAIKFIKTAQ